MENAGIFEWKGEVLMGYRCYSPRHGRTVIGISKLDSELNPSDKIILELPSKGTKGIQEDARFFTYNNKLHVIYTEIDHSVIPQWHATMRLARLNDDFTLDHMIPLHYGSNPDGIEKNWIFFTDGEKLNFIYDIRTSRVVNIHPNTGRVKKEYEDKQIYYPYGILRGGTIPTKWDDDHLIAFNHTSTDFKWLDRRYAFGAYLIQSKPPYKVTHLSIEPLVYGSRQNLFCGGGNGKCIFPCGHIERNGNFLVSCGVNDTFNCIIQIPREKIEESLIEIEYYQEKHMRYFKGPKRGVLSGEYGDIHWIPIRVGKNLESIIATDDIKALSVLLALPEVEEISKEEFER